MKIVLAGEVLSPNLGDRLIADCVSEILKEIIPSAEIIRLDWGFRTAELNPARCSQREDAVSGIKELLRRGVHKPLRSL